MSTTTPASSLIPTLPGRSYTDPEVFAAEQARIFEAMWFCAARSSDVGTAGAFRTVQVGPGERPGDPQPQGTGSGVLQRVPAPRRAALHPRTPARRDGRSSAPTTRGPTTSTASSWRRRT